jgi:hypothetical protein
MKTPIEKLFDNVDRAVARTLANDKLTTLQRDQAVSTFSHLRDELERRFKLEPHEVECLTEDDIERLYLSFVAARAVVTPLPCKVQEFVLALLYAFWMDREIQVATGQLELPLDDLPQNVVDLCQRANGGITPSPGGPPGRVRAMDNDPDPRNNRAFDDGPDYEKSEHITER